MKRPRTLPSSVWCLLLNSGPSCTTAFVSPYRHRVGITSCNLVVSPLLSRSRLRMSRVDDDDDDAVGTIQADPTMTSTTCTELEQRRQLHALVELADPDWYQEYVLDMLNCHPKDCNYPAVLHRSITITTTSTTVVSNNNSTTSERGSETLVEDREESNQIATIQESSPNSSSASIMVEIEAELSNDEETLAEVVTTQGSAGSSSEEERGTVDSTTAAINTIVATVQVTDPVAAPITPDSTLESSNIATTSTLNMTRIPTQDLLKNTTCDSVDEQDAHNLTEVTTASGTYTNINDDTNITLTSSNKLQPEDNVVHPAREMQVQSNGEVTTAATNDELSTVIVYRDSKEGWKMIASKKLIQLGYMEEELQELLPDALAIIVQEQIRRPRTLGLPPPWRLGPDQTQSELQVVANAEAAQVLLDSLQTKDMATTKSPKVIGRPRISVVPPPKSRSQSMSSFPSASTRGPMTTADYIPQPKPIPRKDIAQKDNTMKKQGSEGDVFGEDTRNVTTVAVQTTASPASSPEKEVDAPKEEERIVLYRDFGNILGLVPLANLTRLGYQEEEIQSMRAEALTVIVSDQVSRPRQGVPPQWKMTDSEQGAEIQMVESLEIATLLVEEDKTARRRRQQLVDSEPVPGRPTRPKEEELRETGESSTANTSARQEDTIPRPRRQRRETIDTSEARKSPQGNTARKSPPRQDADEDLSQDPRRRSRRRDDGSSKRIYNARELQNRREKPALADPPDPNSPIWMDMDTFRTLLRNEAELRLRILGDDWASTVKQESEWRLNLYKKWLWTLHNGVGDSIVPPSRYERARKLKQQQMRDTDLEPSRSPSQDDLPRKKSNRRPRDKGN